MLLHTILRLQLIAYLLLQTRLLTQLVQQTLLGLLLLLQLLSHRRYVLGMHLKLFTRTGQQTFLILDLLSGLLKRLFLRT